MKNQFPPSHQKSYTKCMCRLGHRTRAFFLALAPLFFALPSHACLFDWLGNSGIKGPLWWSLHPSLTHKLEPLGELAQTIVYGETFLGEPLIAYRFQKSITAMPAQSSHQQRPLAIISEATHGNEFLNIVPQLLDWMAQTLQQKPSAHPTGLERFLDTGGIILVIPALNPDGYDAGRRRNAQKIDLNRDFDQLQTAHQGFQSPETRAYKKLIEKLVGEENAKPTVSVDYHCCAGALLYPWSFKRLALPPQDQLRFKKVAQGMRKTMSPFLRDGTPGQVFGYYPEGSSKDYLYTLYGTLAFTFEGRRWVEKNYADQHIRWWDWIFSELTAGTL